MQKKVLPVWAIVHGLLLSSCAVNTQAPTVVKPVVTKMTAPASRVPTSDESGKTPWTTWSEKGTVGGLLVLKGIRENLLQNNLVDPHIDYSGYKTVDCSKVNTRFRTADGTCTDLEHPQTGAANVAFGRNVAPEFIDQDAQEKIMIPNPALVSKELFTRDEFKPVPFLNMLAASWIQFMNHDWLTHGRNVEKNPYKVSVEGGADIEVERTRGNDTNPETYKKDFGKVSLNEVTHWWDGSQIYGSNQTEQNRVRSFAAGKMAMVKEGDRELLPKDSSINIVNNKQNQGYEVTGFKDNWWAGLSMLHHVFVKEHNSIAAMLIKKYAKYDVTAKNWVWKENGKTTVYSDKELDEHVFQTARLINAAVMAKIHTIEWTPAILANDTLKKAMYTNWYGIANPQTWSKLLKHIPALKKTNWFEGKNSGYTIAGIVGEGTNNYGVPYSITEEFTSVYRLHSLLPENLEIKKLSDKSKVETVSFDAVRNEKSYGFMASHDLKDLFYSFGTQHPGQLVLNNFPKFMQQLTIPGHGNMDLAMIDVMRDRERGVPRYNQFRRAINLKPIAKYADFFPANKPLTDSQKAILARLTKVYGKDDSGNDNVEMIDLLVGTLAEEVRPKNFGFGETQFQIFILMASRRLMADRFYTVNYREEYYTQAGLDWVENEGFFKKVILRHMPELAPNLKGVETAFNPWNK